MLFSPLCGDEPQTNKVPRERFYARLAQHKLHELMERVEHLDELIGMGELPANFWHRRQAE
jgi:hypothetical protein